MALYFCHKCNQRCDVTGVDSGHVKCTRCNDRYVEEIQETEAESPPVSIPVDDNPFMMFPASPFSQLFQMLRQPQGQNVQSSSNATPAGSRDRGGYSRGGQERGQPPSPVLGTGQQPSSSGGSHAGQAGGADEQQRDPMANLIQHIFSNLVAQAGAGRNVVNRFISRIVAGGSSDQPEGAFRIHSNIRNYAWEPDGRDNIVTALLNQFTEAEDHARALSKEDIERLPKYKVSQEHVDNKTHNQCTICMETFKLGEDVVKLDCDHIFHFPCIQPWLLRNNSCPICQTEIDPSSKWAPTMTEVDELD